MSEWPSSWRWATPVCRAPPRLPSTRRRRRRDRNAPLYRAPRATPRHSRRRETRILVWFGLVWFGLVCARGAGSSDGPASVGAGPRGRAAL